MKAYCLGPREPRFDEKRIRQGHIHPMARSFHKRQARMERTR